MKHFFLLSFVVLIVTLACGVNVDQRSMTELSPFFCSGVVSVPGQPVLAYAMATWLVDTLYNSIYAGNTLMLPS